MNGLASFGYDCEQPHSVMHGLCGYISVLIFQCTLKFKAVISGSLEGYISGQAGNQFATLGEE